MNTKKIEGGDPAVSETLTATQIQSLAEEAFPNPEQHVSRELFERVLSGQATAEDGRMIASLLAFPEPEKQGKFRSLLRRAQAGDVTRDERDELAVMREQAKTALAKWGLEALAEQPEQH